MRRRPSSRRVSRSSQRDENQTELPLAAVKERIVAALDAALRPESGAGLQPTVETLPQNEKLDQLSPEPPPIMPVRRLQNYAYCPRLFYYQWVENLFEENADTVEGSALHR